METITNPISGAEMIVPSTPLSHELYALLCCVTQIADWECHPEAFDIQQEVLQALEEDGAEAAAVHVEEIRKEIEAVFFQGKTDEVLAALKVAA